MPSPRLLLGLTLVVAAVGSMPATADVGRIVSPAGGGVLVAGSAVEIRWQGLATDIDEMEILLSVDGGRKSRLRLSPQLAPGLDRYVWVVPNLPTHHATLRLRVGRHGVEVEGEPGEPFAIVGRADAPAATLRLSGGEWWPDARIAPSPAPEHRPFTLTPPPPPALQVAETLAPTSHEQLAAPPRCAARNQDPRSEGSSPQSAESTAHRPRSVPQRE
jgi:hypothetical protein